MEVADISTELWRHPYFASIADAATAFISDASSVSLSNASSVSISNASSVSINNASIISIASIVSNTDAPITHPPKLIGQN